MRDARAPAPLPEADVMRRIGIAAAVVFGGLALLIAVKLAVPTVAVARADTIAPEPPDAIALNGVLYDFRRGHPDFDVMPAGGAGHYAGTVAATLDGTGRPVLAGGGYRVSGQWQDRYGRPIAPHVAGMRGLAPAGTLGFRVDGPVSLGDGAIVDAFDSNDGPYGTPGNFGRRAVIATNANAPGSVRLHDHAIVRGDLLIGPRAAADGLVEGAGHVTGRRGAVAPPFAVAAPAPPEHLEPYRRLLLVDESTTLTGDLTPRDGRHDRALHCGELRITNDAVLTVDGNLVIRCDRSLDIRRGRIDLRPGATLTVFVCDYDGGSGDVRISDRALVNTESGDAARVTIVALGAGGLAIERSHVCATIIAPDRRLELREGGHLYGAFVGGALDVGARCGLHADLGLAISRGANHGLAVRDSIEVSGGSTIDSFDSTVGPYGDANVHAHAWVSVNAAGGGARVALVEESTIRGNLSVGRSGDAAALVTTASGAYVSGPVGHLATPRALPFPVAPELGPSAGDRHYAGGNHRVNSDLHFRNFTLDHGAVVEVFGNVTLRIDDTLTLADHSAIRLDAGATLTVYVGRGLVMGGHARLNANTGNPRLVSVRLTGAGARMTLDDHAIACAYAEGARADLEIAGASELFGSFAGRSAAIRDGSRLHTDQADLATCVEVFDVTGAAGSAGRGGVASAASFNQWFRTVPGTNEATGYGLTLTRDGDGVYEFADDSFYPLDGRLLGDEGETHNNHFTCAMWARFRYEPCEGQFVSFEGGDGAWLFIDGRLALDLGGVRTRTPQVIDVDRLGLEPGRTYSFRLFTAQRRSGDSVFRLRTSIPLMSDHTAPDLAAQFE